MKRNHADCVNKGAIENPALDTINNLQQNDPASSRMEPVYVLSNQAKPIDLAPQ